MSERTPEILQDKERLQAIFSYSSPCCFTNNAKRFRRRYSLSLFFTINRRESTRNLRVNSLNLTILIYFVSFPHFQVSISQSLLFQSQANSSNLRRNGEVMRTCLIKRSGETQDSFAWKEGSEDIEPDSRRNTSQDNFMLSFRLRGPTTILLT